MSNSYHATSNDIEVCEYGKETNFDKDSQELIERNEDAQIVTLVNEWKENKGKTRQQKDKIFIKKNAVNALHKLKRVLKHGYYAPLRVFTKIKGTNHKFVHNWTSDNNNEIFKIIKIQEVNISLENELRNLQFNN